MIEVIKVAIIFIVFCLVPFLVAGLVFWSILFMTIGVALATLEIVAVVKSGKTLSQQFKESKHKGLVATCLTGFFVYLMGHLFLNW